MSVNGITNQTSTYETKNTSKSSKENTSEKAKTNHSADNTAAVYEKSKDDDSSKKIYKRDQATINRLLDESDKRAAQLRDLVRKMLQKQGQTFNDSTDIYSLLREGKLDVDPETRAQAQKDIAEDGYWGVNQTSDRLVSFAMALSGSDPSKADEMIAAVKKGFDQATEAWGDELPSICKDTLDAAIKKLTDWRDSLQGTGSVEEEAKDAFAGQAAAEAMSK